MLFFKHEFKRETCERHFKSPNYQCHVCFYVCTDHKVKRIYLQVFLVFFSVLKFKDLVLSFLAFLQERND